MKADHYHKPQIGLLVLGISVIIISIITFLLLNCGTLSPEKTVETPSPSPSVSMPSVLPSTNIKIEVKDYVCGRMLDPSRSVATSLYMDRTFYFDTMECKKAFDESPLKYIPIKIKVKIMPGPEISVSPPAEEPPLPLQTEEEENYWEEQSPPGENPAIPQPAPEITKTPPIPN